MMKVLRILHSDFVKVGTVSHTLARLSLYVSYDLPKPTTRDPGVIWQSGFQQSVCFSSVYKYIKSEELNSESANNHFQNAQGAPKAALVIFRDVRRVSRDVIGSINK